MLHHLTDRLANTALPGMAELLLTALCWPALAAGEPPQWDLRGTPEEIGAQEARLAGTTMKPLLRVLGTGAWALTLGHAQRTSAWIDGIPTAHRQELDALIAGSGLDARRLLRTNVLVEACCSVAVLPASASQPLRIARNMDFFPAGTVGSGTVIKRYAVTGKIPFVAVSWPGYAGVVSGMNRDGVVVCVLLNHQGRRLASGTPITFRLREMLEECSDVPSAVARFAAAPVASEHYVLIADARQACVVWQEAGLLRRGDPINGALTIDNGPRDADGNPTARRARHLAEVITALGAVQHHDDELIRRLTTASFQRGTNAQAMTFTPAEGALSVATGGLWRAAARRGWWRFSVASNRVEALPAVESLPHHTAWWRARRVAALQ